MAKERNAKQAQTADPPISESEAQNIRLWVALLQASNFMNDVREKDTARYHVTNIESAILNAIHEIGFETTPAKITRRISILRPHSISESLTSMEKRGLVAKNKDLPRKNLVRIALTEKGKATLSQTGKRESVHRMFAILTKEEKNQLEPILDKLLKEALKERLMAPLLYHNKVDEKIDEKISQIYHLNLG